MFERDDVAELTVEDPAEDFEDLRDRNDLRYLVKHKITEEPEFLADVGAEERGPRAAWEAATRKKHKIAQVGSSPATTHHTRN
jgi:histone acetyltransferase 1